MNEQEGTARLSSIGSPRAIGENLPQHESLVHMFEVACNDRPDVTAIVWEERSVSYRQFGRAVAGLTAELESLGARGGRVIVLMPNLIEMDIALMAVMAAGAQVAPINPWFKPAELKKVLPGIGAKIIICDAGSKEKAESIAADVGVETVLALGPGARTIDQWIEDEALVFAPETKPAADDLALLIFTGGSTGVPKGVDHTHRGLMWGLLQHVSVWPLRYGEERFLNVAPMFHIWGLAYSTWVPIYTAGTLVMVPKYDPDTVVRGLHDHQITVFSGGPAPIYMGLFTSKHFETADLSNLKYCPSGGAPCPEDLHRQWLERTGVPLLEGWGMTEGAPFCLNPLDGPRKILSVGNPVPETHVEIVDIETGDTILPRGQSGEVRVKGPQLMTGYRDNQEETAQALRDGWMYTGDIGYIDDDGFVCLVDRKKDMVLVGGYNVYPREVDEVLFNHPKISSAATVGKRDARLGEVVVAFVVVNEGDTMTEEEFFGYCSEAMVKYKRPVEVYFVDALPKTRTNKIDRLSLRAMLQKQQSVGDPD